MVPNLQQYLGTFTGSQDKSEGSQDYGVEKKKSSAADICLLFDFFLLPVWVLKPLLTWMKPCEEGNYCLAEELTTHRHPKLNAVFCKESQAYQDKTTGLFFSNSLKCVSLSYCLFLISNPIFWREAISYSYQVNLVEWKVQKNQKVT